MEHVPGRSINLAMSVRGLSALNSIGLGKDLFINGQNTRIKKVLYTPQLIDLDVKFIRIP